MKIDEDLLRKSRSLRKTQTPWEDKLWYYLRAGRFRGYKFKRQVVINHFIVDFCCYSAKLVLELDGGQHNIQRNSEYDLVRTRELERLGYKVLRFWNNQIDQAMDEVLAVIDSFLTTSPALRAPSPKRRGEI